MRPGVANKTGARILLGLAAESGLPALALADDAAAPRGVNPTTSFVELADRFPDFVRVLGAIIALELFRSEQDAVRLYRRWLQTGSAREADLLIRRGLIPVPPPTRRQ